MKSADPKLDVVFKMLFAPPSASDLLIGLLTDVLQPSVPITSVTVLNPDLPKDRLNDRGAVLDLRVRLQDGREVGVEMQMDWRKAMVKRAVYYVTRLYRSQLDAGGNYADLRPRIAIFILAYRQLPSDRFHSKYRLCEVHTGQELSDEIEVHILELPKLPPARTEAWQREGALANWGALFQAKDEKLLEELAMSDPRIAKAQEILRDLARDPEAQRLIREREESLKLYRMELNEVREDALAEGKAEGKAEAVLAVLAARGLAISEAQRAAVMKADAALLDRLIVRAATASSADELFVD